MPTDWSPDAYLRFDDLRTRPAIDLLARIPAPAPRLIVDLGCGPGNSTRLLRQRWPTVPIVAVDSSAAMIAAARQRALADPALERVDWTHAAIENWEPGEPPDVIFSNAALHWLDDHEHLFPALLSRLAPGGALAVQMPHRDGRQPFVEALHDTAAEEPWRGRLADLDQRRWPGARDYYEWLSPHAAALDIWTTEYLQPLRGDDPVWHWTAATAQRPFLERLTRPDAEAFAEAYRLRLRAAYRAETDGVTLFPFPRLFVVAVAHGARQS